MKKHQSGFLAVGDALQTEDRRLEDGASYVVRGTEDADLLKRYRDMGAARVVVTLRPETADKTLPVLDRWADLIRHVRRAKE